MPRTAVPSRHAPAPRGDVCRSRSRTRRTRRRRCSARTRQSREQESVAAAPRRRPCARRPAGRLPPRAISDILEPPASVAARRDRPDLPPDHPLEPGTRPTGARTGDAFRADRRFRKRAQRDSPRAEANPSAPRISLPPRAAPRRPPPPHRQRETDPRSSQGRRSTRLRSKISRPKSAPTPTKRRPT